MPVRALARSINRGQRAFEEGKAFGVERRSRSTASEINDFLNSRAPTDDFERGFFEGLRG